MIKRFAIISSVVFDSDSAALSIGEAIHSQLLTRRCCVVNNNGN